MFFPWKIFKERSTLTGKGGEGLANGHCGIKISLCNSERHVLLIYSRSKLDNCIEIHYTSLYALHTTHTTHKTDKPTMLETFLEKCRQI